MYSGKVYKFTHQQYRKIDTTICDLNQKFLKTEYGTLAISDIKYAGLLSNSPVIDKDYIPAGQQSLDSSPYVDIGGLLETGDLKGQKEKVSKFLREEWKKHIARWPELDKKWGVRYRESHLSWLYFAGLDSTDKKNWPKSIKYNIS